MTGEFGQLNMDRHISAPAARVFEALLSAQDRMAWGPPDAGSVVIIDAPDTAAPGKRELSRCGPRDNPYVDVATDWIVIEAPERLIYAETLSAEGALLATSLATCELVAQGSATHLRVTVQIANFAGVEMMPEIEAGWSHAVSELAAHVEAP